MANKITIIGLGPGGRGDISLKAMDRLKCHGHIYLRTKDHPIVSYLKEININFKSFDYLYDKYDDFQEVYQNIAEEVIKYAREYKEVTYAVPGHPLVAEESVNNIVDLSKENNIEVEILPSMSFIDALINALNFDPIHGLKIIDGLDIENQGCDIKVANIITQVYSPLVASRVKLQLMEYFDDETPIWVVRAAGVEDLEKLVEIPLYELDRLSWIDHLTSVYIPPVQESQLKGGQIERLLAVVETLRSENGCSWDKKQSHESMKQHLIEEAYEVVDAIDKKSVEDLEEELGDVLLHIVFHSQIAKENGNFTFSDVIRGICDKLVYRHPHVFSQKSNISDQEIQVNWEKLKKAEKGMDNQTEVLKAIPPSLPALIRASKVQKKASDIGFDWIEIEDVISKVKEEWHELMDAYSSGDKEEISEELGDLLFSIVNVSRFMNIQPELALGQTIEKFINRFSYIEEKSLAAHKKLEEMTLEDMDKLWNQAKVNNFSKNNKNY